MSRAAALRLAAAALALCAVSPAVARPVPLAAAPQPDALRERALQIARLLNDPKTTEESAGREFIEGLRAAAKTDPQAISVEQAYPGFFEEFGQAMLPFFTNLIRTSLPTLWERQADFFVAHYTLAELDQIYAFYSSPAGQRLIAAMNEHFDADAMAAKFDLEGGDRLSVDSLEAGIRGAMPAILARMSPADRSALLALVETPVGRKLMNNATALGQISVAWINEILLENPAFKAEGERQAKAILERRMRSGK